MALPSPVIAALHDLNAMLRQFWPDRTIPLEFWLIEDDVIFFDALQYLPCCLGSRMYETADIAMLPEGFRVALAIFDLEDGFSGEGWHAINNAGEDGLRNAIAAYRTVGLPVRAAALERVLLVYLAGTDDTDDYRNAARGELAELVDDHAATAIVQAWLQQEPERLFGPI
ncbi:hypothetical protein SAMN02745857_02174 [Andreprevotia lacus DSM 23236]|jgi:GAF domain-containing protein|uniref:DUF4375 domain-containing protein n=1 Tax=Andreprevotia lacus DSM 23236 TaxID=1121001 RepID=A0A1W1XPK2_9NEIS|nr:hypothetical protein [Andreprevotia lacus]SMC25451.1 hypothetical protein SAMN02745857_02174 [Andreprevotia lacus DSM 23236]